MAPASVKAKFLAVAFSASPDAQAPAWPNWNNKKRSRKNNLSEDWQKYLEVWKRQKIPYALETNESTWTSVVNISPQVPIHQATMGLLIRPLLMASQTRYSSTPPTSPRRTNIFTWGSSFKDKKSRS
jgi:hypothetical protein